MKEIGSSYTYCFANKLALKSWCPQKRSLACMSLHGLLLETCEKELSNQVSKQVLDSLN